MDIERLFHHSIIVTPMLNSEHELAQEIPRSSTSQYEANRGECTKLSARTYPQIPNEELQALIEELEIPELKLLKEIISGKGLDIRKINILGKKLIKTKLEPVISQRLKLLTNHQNSVVINFTKAQDLNNWDDDASYTYANYSALAHELLYPGSVQAKILLTKTLEMGETIEKKSNAERCYEELVKEILNIEGLEAAITARIEQPGVKSETAEPETAD